MVAQARINNWQKLLIKLGLFDNDDQDLWTYEENSWLKQAFINYEAKRFHSRRVEDAQCGCT